MSKRFDMLGRIMCALVGILEERLGVLLDTVNKVGGDEGELWKVRLATVLREGVKQEVVAPSEPPVFFRQLYTDRKIFLGPTSGTRVISPENELAKSIFLAGIDSDFVNWGLDVPSEPMVQTEAIVYEQELDGTFAQCFQNVGRPLEQLKFTPDQIIEFVITHKDKLRWEGYGTFFLFKVRNEFFVAYVDVGSGGRLFVGVHRFSGGRVWRAQGLAVVSCSRN